MRLARRDKGQTVSLHLLGESSMSLDKDLDYKLGKEEGFR